MTERISNESDKLTAFEQASRHLLETLGVYSPIELRDTPHGILWDAREYAEMTSADAVINLVDEKGLADASFGFGTRSFTEPISPELIVKVLQSPRFTKLRHNVWDHVPEHDVRSLIFFSQGVKYAAAVLHDKHRQARQY